MKQLLILLVLCMAMHNTQAQTPQYALAPLYAWDSLKREQSPLRAIANVMQSIYYDSDFPSMPIAGNITHFYVSIGSVVDSGLLIYGYRVKMMQTNVDSFNLNTTMNTPYAVSPQVFYESQFRAPQHIPQDGWLKVALQTPFSYDFSDADSPNLMIEISADSSFFAYPMDSLPPYVNYNYCPHLSCIYSTITSTPNAGIASQRPVIGFDIIPASGVEELSGAEAGNMLYPNPATETLHINQSGIYKIYDMQGRLVKTGANDPAKDIDVSNLAKGVYQLDIVTPQNKNLHQRFIKN